MSEHVQAVAFVATVTLALLAGLLILAEIVFTRPLDRPSVWSGASLCSLIAAGVALTVGDWPFLVTLWGR